MYGDGRSGEWIQDPLTVDVEVLDIIESAKMSAMGTCQICTPGISCLNCWNHSPQGKLGEGRLDIEGSQEGMKTYLLVLNPTESVL